MRIALLIEGKTEKAFLPHLRRFLETRLAGKMPRIDPVVYDGQLPKGDKLRRDVERLLEDGKRKADAVVALTDICTGKRDFLDADDAKRKMRDWAGNNDRFYPHAAQYEFEAWLLPYWGDIQRLAGSDRNAPAQEPENVDHEHPPSDRIAEVFRTGKNRGSYVKARDARKILDGRDLLVAARACPQLKLFLNTLLTLCGEAPL